MKCPNCGAEGLLEDDFINLWVKYEGKRHDFKLCVSCYDSMKLEAEAKKHLIKVGAMKEE